jgi:hypothetical protein
MSALSPRTRQILLAAGAAGIVILVVVAGIAIGNRLGGSQENQAAVVVQSAVTVEPQPTVTLAAPAEASRTAVEGGRAETDTGIAILPAVTLRGDRRYVLQVTSKAGKLSFSGSYSRGSIDPKVAIDAMQEFKGMTPWEQVIEPPSPGARTWTLGVNLSTSPIGKHVLVQVWDIGPK